MKVAKIRIGGRMFILDPAQDIEQLRQEIVVAATSGAGFVHFRSAAGVAVSALVTPHLPVRISEVERESEPTTPIATTAPGTEDPPFAVGTHFDG